MPNQSTGFGQPNFQSNSSLLLLTTTTWPKNEGVYLRLKKRHCVGKLWLHRDLKVSLAFLLQKLNWMRMTRRKASSDVKAKKAVWKSTSNLCPIQTSSNPAAHIIEVILPQCLSEVEWMEFPRDCTVALTVHVVNKRRMSVLTCGDPLFQSMVQIRVGPWVGPSGFCSNSLAIYTLHLGE